MKYTVLLLSLVILAGCQLGAGSSPNKRSQTYVTGKGHYDAILMDGELKSCQLLCTIDGKFAGNEKPCQDFCSCRVNEISSKVSITAYSAYRTAVTQNLDPDPKIKTAVEQIDKQCRAPHGDNLKVISTFELFDTGGWSVKWKESELSSCKQECNAGGDLSGEQCQAACDCYVETASPKIPPNQLRKRAAKVAQIKAQCRATP